MLGIIVVLVILYQYGSHPWALTHARVHYKTTKTVHQTCWMVKSRNIYKEWDQRVDNLTTKEKWLVELGNIEGWINLAGSDNLTAENAVVQDLQELEDGVVVQILMLQKRVMREVSCNWIRPEAGDPAWYCTWGCRPLIGLTTQGYWEKEAIFPAPQHNATCVTILPRWTFWGSYNLTCTTTGTQDHESDAKESPRRPTNPSTIADTVNDPTTHTQTPASTPAGPDPGTRSPMHPPNEAPPSHTVPLARPPLNDSTLNLLEPASTADQRAREVLLRNITWDCVKKKLVRLDPCYWNVGKGCTGQNYMVLAPETRLGFFEWRGAFGRVANAHHEDWLNKTLPWVWTVPLWHFRGTFSAGQLWTGRGLKGPYQTGMYVQKLPKPTDLMFVPSGDFQKIDECVAERMFQDLNNTEFESTGKSPRCPLDQYKEGWGVWRYDCRGLRVNKTIKGVLQAWKEGHVRNEGSTWWGLEKQEVQDWVIPCLRESENYWVKYQYLATVYSKDRDIWPGSLYRPDPFVNPRPWRMVCDRANTTCTISLVREPCQHVPGWEDYCNTQYEQEYDTYGHQTVWKKIRTVWVRAFPEGVGCAKAVLGHGMSRRRKVIGQIVPFAADPILMLAEGHAFRRSMCEGNESTGFEWLGPNSLYNSSLCYPQEEHWMRCGEGQREHECTWGERTRIVIKGGLTTLLEETEEIIGEGLSAIGGWVGNLLLKIWPYTLILFGLIISGVIVMVLIKGGVEAALHPCGKKPSRKRKDRRRHLLEEEGLTNL